MDKLPKVTNETEIQELLEHDDLGQRGNCFGYFAIGHWDAQSFAIACNQEFDLADFGRPVCTSEVKQNWQEAVEVEGETALIFRDEYRDGFEAVTSVVFY